MLTKPSPPPPRIPGTDKFLAARPDPRAWDAILHDCGYSADVLVIDFETFFSSDFGMGGTNGLTTIEYVQSPQFEILGCAFLKFGEKEFFQVGEDMVATQLKCYQKLYGDDLQRCTVVMQNANFDSLILSRKFGIHPPYLIDTLALARHWNSRQKHGLATLAPQFGLPEKGETENFSGMTFRKRYTKGKGRKKGPKMPVEMPVATPDQGAKLAEYACNDVRLEAELFKILLPKLSNPAIELRLQHHTLELFTRPALRLNVALGDEIKVKMEAEIDKALEPVSVIEHNGEEYITRSVTREEISSNTQYEHLLVEALKAAGDNPMNYMKPVKGGKFKFADAKQDTDSRAALVNHADERVRQVMAARNAVKSWPLHIARVSTMQDMARADEGQFPIPLRYHGAHTGRWSGSDGVNPQNFGSRGHELIATVRHMIVPPEGHSLVIVDAAQIEARGTDWIAGQDDSLARWANGEDQYSYFASKVVGFKVRKPVPTDPPSIAKRLKTARDAIGKIGVLGCQYGMGPYEPGSGKTKPNLFFAAAGLDIGTAEKIVATFRRDQDKVVQFWKDVERAFIYTVKYRRPCSLPRGIRFDSTSGCDVLLTLPNGRELKYVNVKIAADRRNDQAEVWNEVTHAHEYIWGGTLTENIVQALSRDILAEAMLRVEDRGYHCALHVHDELVLVVPDDQAEAALAVAEEEMARTPTWATGIPLDSEGKIKKWYQKI